MKQFLFFVKKEFYHLIRDRQTFFILLGIPVVLILIFGFALTNEVKNSRIAVLDLAKDASSRAIIERLEASRYFDIQQYLQSNDDLEPAFKSGKVRLVVVFPANFEHELLHGNAATIQLIGDATDPNISSTLINYATAVIMDYQASLRDAGGIPLRINTEMRMLYNPQLKGSYNFVPGVMAMVLMLVCAMMTSISIVREKELGTMEVILVSPIIPLRMVFAKMIPYFLLSVVNIISILFLSVYVLDVPIQGSLVLLLLECMLFTVASLALGLFISSISNSQQAAMLISLIGLLVPTIMLSGFMFPIENMPSLLQFISNAVPARWFYSTVISVMIKGLEFKYVWKETLILFSMIIFFLAISIKNFKTRLE